MQQYSSGTSGGKLNDEFVQCGGWNDDCFILGQHNPIENLKTSKSIDNYDGGVVLPNDTLLIIGTKYKVLLCTSRSCKEKSKACSMALRSSYKVVDNGFCFLGGRRNSFVTNTTELITISPPNSWIGPVTLPYPILNHCTVLVDNLVYVIGGHEYLYGSYIVLKKAFSISIHDGLITNVSDMNVGHAYHGCASFKDGNKTFIAVAGGQATNYTSRNITEIFDIQENVWSRGKRGCKHFSMSLNFQKYM